MKHLFDLVSDDLRDRLKVHAIDEGISFLGAATITPEHGAFIVYDTTCPPGVEEDDPDDTKFPVVCIGSYQTASEAVVAADEFVTAWLRA